MYPEGTLINSNKNNLVVFEKDINNPSNEGFICLWTLNNKRLIFKKRLSKIKATNKWTTLIKKGWIQKKNIDKAA